jgi:dipeptidyl aminopeptidase/acylaminoacyl peptidase
VDTGDLELVAENPGDVAGWVADHQGRVRAAVSLTEGSSRILYRETEADPWREVARSRLLDLYAVRGFTFDGELMYVSSYQGRDTEALYTFDPLKGEIVEELFAHPEVDFYTLFYSYKKRILRGVSFLHEHMDYHIFDPEGLGIQKDIEARLPGYLPWVTTLSDDESRMTVRTYTDRSRGSYYLLDRPQDRLVWLADVSPWIDESDLCVMEPLRYPARDGRQIWAYRILPQGLKPHDLPLVVIPCSWPWQRFVWDYHATAQFLANRGYAVLMVNPRGSFGYGKDYLSAGFGEWGGAVLDDLEDGARWLIEQGTVDPGRVGIFGQSAGGFLALASAMLKPNTYRCAVSYSGPVSLRSLVASPPSHWYSSRDIFYAMVGDPNSEADLARMTAYSPLGQEERFTIPLLVIQGVNDPLISAALTDSFVSRLGTLDKQVRYLRQDDEGHSFSRTKSRNNLYRAVEITLGEYLGGRIDPRAEQIQ